MEQRIRTAMLIDDEEIDQRSYHRVLARSGIVDDVLSFTYADTALEHLRANPDLEVDAVFLDINMPRMNGFEFLDQALAELGPNFARVVVVMLTTSIDPLDRERAARNPLVRDFFNKPLTVEHVKSVAGWISRENSFNEQRKRA